MPKEQIYIIQLLLSVLILLSIRHYFLCKRFEKRIVWAKRECRTWVAKQGGNVIEIKEKHEILYDQYSFLVCWQDKIGNKHEMFLSRHCLDDMDFKPEIKF